jgi:Fe-S-cluster containining protein
MMTDSDYAGPVLRKYLRRLRELEDWFRSIQAKHAGRMRCGQGCVGCCLGLFDLPLPDAFVAAEGYRRLPDSVRIEVRRRAGAIHAGILHEAPELESPFFLGGLSDERIDSLADRFRDVRCPFLGSDDRCLIYAHRPSACRLEGIPMVDARDGPFDDWCELNFTKGMTPEIERDLRFDYYELESAIRSMAEILADRMLLDDADATVFIPSVIVALEDFWSRRFPACDPLGPIKKS